MTMKAEAFFAMTRQSILGSNEVLTRYSAEEQHHLLPLDTNSGVALRIVDVFRDLAMNTLGTGWLRR